MLTKCTVFIILILNGGSISSNLSSKFNKCSVKDVHFENCLAKSVDAAVKMLKHGLPEFNLLPLDPLRIPDVVIEPGEGAVSLKQKLSNTVVYGYSDINVNRFRANLKKKVFRMDVFTLSAQIEADYDLNGHLLSLPMQGIGHYKCRFPSLNMTHVLHAEEVTVKNEKYYNITKYSVRLFPSKVIYSLDNLFNGNDAMRDIIVNTMNDNWDIIFADNHQDYENALEKVLHEYANAVFTQIPVKDLFIY